VQPVGLASWLASLASEEQPPDGKTARAASSLLVFDVPGQEAALLEALPDDDLRRFSWIVLRHWRHPGSAQLADAARERLARAGFDQILPTAGAVGAADAQIVQELFRFDERREEMRLLSAERDAMRAHASQLERMLAEMRRSLREAEEGRQSAESSLHDSRTREAMLSGEVATLAARHQELSTANERHLGTAADLQAQVTRLEADRAGLQRLCDSLRLSLQAAEAARDRSDEERRSAEGRFAALEAREAELSSTIATLEAQQAGLADRAERDANSARDAEARSTQVHAELVELRNGSDALREKLRAAETSVAELGRKHQDAEALARSRMQELDAANKQLVDERKNGRVQAQRIEKLEADLLDAQFRLETLQHELLKAEGQLEVVKDLLLNESTL
jgi:chromosome segregation ATPase